MRDIKIIATDMDHTLLTENDTLPPHFGDYLDRLEALGVQFAIASGRPLNTLRNLFPEHKDRLVMISDNGGVIADHGRIVQKNLIPLDAVQEIRAFVRENTLARPIICTVDSRAIADQLDRPFEKAYRQFYHDLSFMDDQADWTGECDKISLYLPEGSIDDLYEQVIAPRFGADFSAAVTGDVWIDIMMKDVNKGTSLKALGDKMQVTADQMMAFGDNSNDKEMLQLVKYSYLVANAKPHMAPFADYRTGSNQEFGVTQVLDQVLAAKEA